MKLTAREVTPARAVETPANPELKAVETGEVDSFSTVIVVVLGPEVIVLVEAAAQEALLLLEMQTIGVETAGSEIEETRSVEKPSVMVVNSLLVEVIVEVTDVVIPVTDVLAEAKDAAPEVTASVQEVEVALGLTAEGVEHDVG